MIHYALRTQIPRISCYTKLLVVVKGFRYRLISNTWYPFELLRLSVRKNCHLKRNAVRSKDPGYLFAKNCHAFERLGLYVGKNCHPPFERSGYPFKELSSVSTARIIRSKILSAVILFQTTFTPSSETQGQSVWSGEGASEVQGRKQAPGY